MSILYPYLLWLLIPIGVLFYYRSKQITDTIHLIILTLLVIALSRPALDKGPQERKVDAKEIIIALDVSYSMRANDIEPNRYEFAVQTIESLLKKNLSDNITLIAFTTNPLLLSPPTTDHQLISLALKSLRLENILTHGTSLEKLLTKVSDLPINDKNLILITDGGDEKDELILNSIIEDNAIHPIILAMGTTSGSTISKPDGSFLKDDEGNLVVSRINPLLEVLSSQNSGTYMTPKSSPEATANELQDALDTLNTEEQQISKMSHSYLELYPIPLFLALILFLLVHTRGVKYLLVLSSLLGSQAQASIFDVITLDNAYHSYTQEDYNRSKEMLSHLSTKTLQSQVALANSYYKLGEYKQAIKIYTSIRSTSLHVKQMLFYNIANAYTKLESYDKARKYYTQALQLGEDDDASANLALIALLQEKKASLGIAHPQSQNNSSSKSEDQEQEQDDGKETRSEDQPSSGSGSGGSEQKRKNKEKMKLIEDQQSKQEQPISSKIYEMINKGYIHEKQPW
ncbi:VWA domain-containing protein [Sulfurovum sp. zt1-1]|uniref:VWA domain-containing protein n=1 Tax=Sulfurovum zhangzhouensis TaxID=3019067 RepID=A0ABT7QUY2_9BACT|nr:VWA domain-containing protein [Sulfurovum zhangzhouensis]MDM5270650.1 VWA domain-containing protein [Sulfurovum zhangzhouensis]